MQFFIKKLHLPQILFLISIIPISLSQEIPLKHCGNITLQSPNHSLLRQMILCKSDNLYFRTSTGLFRISSIDYSNKLLTVSHKLSPASAFVSPHHLSAGFPSPPLPNSLFLFNCSNQTPKMLPLRCDHTQLSGLEGLAKGFSSCSVIDDIKNLDKDFNPKERNCSHYSRVYKNVEKFELGTRISFDVPDHVPNPCDQCEKSNGNCGIGLRCVCHPRTCRDKVISHGAVLKPFGNTLSYLILFVIVMESRLATTS